MSEARQQDIVWVRFPYSDLKEHQFRPAVVISNDGYNQSGLDAMVCAITSKLDKREYSVLIDQSDIDEGKLPLKSRIRADKVMQVSKSLIAKAFARLNAKTFDLVVNEISKLVKRGRQS